MHLMSLDWLFGKLPRKDLDSFGKLSRGDSLLNVPLLICEMRVDLVLLQNHFIYHYPSCSSWIGLCLISINCWTRLCSCNNFVLSRNVQYFKENNVPCQRAASYFLFDRLAEWHDLVQNGMTTEAVCVVLCPLPLVVCCEIVSCFSKRKVIGCLHRTCAKAYFLFSI